MITERRRLNWSDWPVFALAGLTAVLVMLGVLYVSLNQNDTVDARRELFSGLARNIDDVALTASTGERLHWQDLNGRAHLVFFGFTHCPEVCPTTVAELGAAIDEIGPAAQALQVNFVTVDPARDTPEALGAYFASFGPHFRGLSTDRASLDRVIASFQAMYEYIPTEGGDYTVNHTAITYLINAEGRVVDIIGYGTPHERVVAQLRTFLTGSMS